MPPSGGSHLSMVLPTESWLCPGLCPIHSLVLTTLPGQEAEVQGHEVTDAKLTQQMAELGDLIQVSWLPNS